jgi:uncharacterized repeat protein (TIGR02543 family)
MKFKTVKSKVIFFLSILSLFGILFCIESCQNDLTFGKTTININLDLSKIIKTSRNENSQNNTEFVLKLFVYDAQNYKNGAEIEKLPLVTQSVNKVDITGNVKVSLEVSIDSTVVLVAKLYTLIDKQESEKPLYAGNSEVFKVLPKDNKVHLVLKKSSADIDVDIELEETFTITFNSLGGSSVESQSVVINSNVTSPEEPTKTGYDFLGWYDNAAFLGSPLASIPAHWAGTLYAKWDVVRIHWHLNGGIVENIPMPAPTQEQLWAEFKVDANVTMLDSLSTIKKEDRPMNTICSSLLADNVTAVYALSKWSWLKSYIQDVQHAQVGEIIVGIDGTTRTVAELNDEINATNATSTQWRYSTAAFFVQMQYDKYPATADFSTAGQPSVWGKVYQQTHTTNVLPKLVYTTYVLPTPTHPQGYTFLGWSTNAEGTNFVTEINETFEGALYAIWQQQGGVGTSVDQVVLTPENAQMYDLLGRPVGQNYKGIVIQNGKKYLLK